MLISYLIGSHLIIRSDHQALQWILDLSEATGMLARRMLRLKNSTLRSTFDQKNITKPQTQYLECNKTTNETKRIANIDVDISKICIFEQISNANTVSERSANKVGPLPPRNKLMKAQVNDVFCQILKEVLKEDGTITVNEDGLLCREAPTKVAIQTIVPKRYSGALLYHGHCTTLARHPGKCKMYNVSWRAY